METETVNINLNTPINTLSYGIVGLNILKALSKKKNMEVSLFPIGGNIDLPNDPSYQKDIPIIQQALSRASFFDHHAPNIRIYHQFSLADSFGYGHRFGFPIFELDNFDKLELHHLNSVDDLLVCSQWAKDIIWANTNIIPNAKVVPLGVDREIYNEKNVQYERKHPDRTNFLNIGKWEIRKGHDVLIEAFNKAFEITDNVALVMHCHCPFSKDRNTEWTKYAKNSKMGEKILVTNNRMPSEHYIAQLIQGSDCGVFPARAEGWNLSGLNMLSMGKQLITTNYSGHTEYVTDKNSYLIPISTMEAAVDIPWFDGLKGQWASLGSKEIDILVEYMRKIHKDKQENKLPLNQDGIETAKRFSWENTVNKILEVL